LKHSNKKGKLSGKTDKALFQERFFRNTVRLYRRIAYLNDGLRIINGTAAFPLNAIESDDEVKSIEGTTHKVMLKQQLQLIVDLSKNIYLQSNKIKFK
jgi:hypothetical protein